MFCKNCGKELPDSAKWCSSCGTQLVPQVSFYHPNAEQVPDPSPTETVSDISSSSTQTEDAIPPTQEALFSSPNATSDMPQGKFPVTINTTMASAVPPRRHSTGKLVVTGFMVVIIVSMIAFWSSF